ncbi:MAG: hypothetical protein IJ354_00225 [Clostridia bacterium]|nr:hypothetical protein [Clostridia bacterium]
MSKLQFTVNAQQVVREWPRIEQYQNSTLRYTPPKDFSAYWQQQICRPKIIRTWVTLDEIWNCLTDEYDWNYQIGVDKLGEKRYYPYDWPKTRPSETHFEDYLTTFCAMADEAMLNIRRFERELTDGIMEFAKYEEVVENVIEHCVELCPNIVYIEASNEPHGKSFGKLTIPEYMPIYDAICRVVGRLNRKHGWNLKVGGNAMVNHFFFNNGWHDYMKALSEDTCPDLRIDFYSMHIYNTDHNALNQMYNIHHADVVKYGLPDVPVFFDEYGTQQCSEEPIENLMNASGILTGMMRASDLANFHIFPWCTFHNPVLQMSYTQFIRLPEGGYAPTANGHAMKMLSNMLKDEVIVRGDTSYRVRATKDGSRMYIIVTNPVDEAQQVNFAVTQLEGVKAKISISQVDEKNNNAVMNPPCMKLEPTNVSEAVIVEGEIGISLELPRYGFAGIEIEVE